MITVEDIFPRTPDTQDKYRAMFPSTVLHIHQQLKTQNQLANAARVLMDTVRAMDEMHLSDDQRRARDRLDRHRQKRFSSAVKKNNE